jgi:Phage integrase family
MCIRAFISFHACVFRSPLEAAIATIAPPLSKGHACFEVFGPAYKLLLARDFTLNDARHSCGTALHLRGVPIAVIAEWLGHADAATTAHEQG